MKLVGRESELEQLRDTCRRARDGRGRVVVITGDAGLGKSALAETIAAEVESAFAVTWGRAWELADAPAYFPLWPCLKSLGIANTATAADAGTFELWERVLEGLVQASEKKPAVWIVEDLHVADTQTLDLLCFLAQAIRALPVVLIATTRPQDARLDDNAQKRIVRLVRDGLELRLGPLDVATCGSLATQWLGRALEAKELEQLAERTGGNPLFVVECARSGKHLLASVPPTVAVVVSERVSQLARATRALVGDAAIIGNEVTAATLAAMNAETTPARVIDELGPALKAGILEELAPGRFRFSHALVREAIEANLPAPGRAAAHARAERALAALPESPRVTVELARHALAAITPERATHAAELAEQAITVLEQQGTYDRAIALFRQLHELRAAGTLPASTSADLVRGSRLALAAGRFAESRALALEAAAMARATGHADDFARAALALGAQLHPGVIDPDIVSHLEEAKRPAGSTLSPALDCRVTARLAAALQPAPDPNVPIVMARAAIADARAMKDPALLEDVLFVAISAMTEFVDAAEMLALNIEHLALARSRDDADRIIRAHVRCAFNHGELGDMAAFDQNVDEMLRFASSVGHPRIVWRALTMASMRAIARGQFAESERYLAEVERAAELTDDPSLSLSMHAHKFYRAVELHRETSVTNMIPHIAEGMKHMPRTGAWLLPMIRGHAAARFGDIAGVERAMAGYPLDALFATTMSNTQYGLFGEVVAAHGTTAHRKHVLGKLLPIIDRHGYMAQAPMAYGGPIRRTVGLLEISLGNRAAGEQHLRKALEVCRSLGYATWVARISFELGERDEAARLANNLGIRGLARRANVTTESAAPVTKPALGLVREGPVWRISYGVRVTRVADNRGMELIAKLVERAGEDLHVLVLAGTGGDTLVDSDAGEALDERAAKSYRARLAEITEELELAKSERAKQLIAERDFLQAELSRAFGLANAPRKTGSLSERARVNVQRRIKDSLTRISAQDSVIADYLRSAIRTGTYCTFRP